MGKRPFLLRGSASLELLRQTKESLAGRIVDLERDIPSLGQGLGVDGKTTARCLDLLVDLPLVRRLSPFHANAGQRLVKSPRCRSATAVCCTACWASTTGRWCSAIRGRETAEIDFVLGLPGSQRWAIEVKRGQAPKPGRGFHQARADLQPQRTFLVCAGEEHFGIGDGIEQISPSQLAGLLQELT